ncbi:hypothetical protein L484_006281 [Morus notabilis]|uniref:Uncharacterized protein n=1 Tax=Morus notabilis TaxID=981085 RepID=W9R4T9_9ROSA|nr:hypothetical protein L484_006281 [Morus notabilis]
MLVEAVEETTAKKEEEMVVFDERGNVRVEEEREVGLVVGVVGMRPRPPVRSHRRRGGYGGGQWSSRKVEGSRERSGFGSARAFEKGRGLLRNKLFDLHRLNFNPTAIKTDRSVRHFY